MSLLGSLINLAESPFRHHEQSPAQQQNQSAPDVTYNPNPNTNIPYSSHDLRAVQLMPGHTGLPAAQINIPQAPVQVPQGNAFNPGATPLQNSGFGPGGNPQIRAFNQPYPNTVDPQDKNQPYYY